MGGIIDKITEFIKELLQGWVLTNFENMFTDVNDKVGTIAGEVSKTPSTWNSGIFDMIKTLSDNVMIPIAGMIISFVLVYELISMVIDKNNLHDFNTAIFIRFFMKACIAVMLLSKTFDIVMAVFDVSQSVISSASGLIQGSTDISADMLADLETTLEGMGVGELLGLFMQSILIQVCMFALNIIIFVIVYGRMLEIYLMTSLAPIPVATLSNRETGQMGQNYIKSLFAVGFQGLLILLCVGIYGVLVQGIADLVLVYPDHLELLDYKTDRRKAESDFLRAYRAQLNLYAIAIEKRFAPKKVTYKGIYSFALGKLIEA